MPGNILIGQAGGATAVINSSLAGAIRAAQESGRFSSILGMCRGAEGALQADLVDLTNLSSSGLDAVARTPGAILGSSRHKLSNEDADRLLDLFRQRDIHTLLYIGGNDSADTVHRLAQLALSRNQDLRAIAIPKTIDNDLPVTDHSPGYGSIARYVAVATMDSAQDTESMPTMYPVKFIEVMGRDAGWVAAAAGLARRSQEHAPHLIYMPEFPVSRRQLVDDVRRTHERFGRVVAVVTETMRDDEGRPFAEASAELDAFGHPLLRGTADAMCRLVQTELGLRSRFDKPGSLQRMSMLCASPVDLAEAQEAGHHAVQLALQDTTDRMVTIVRDPGEEYRSRTSSTELVHVANRQYLLPDEFVTPDRRGVSEAFRRYALPLLGPDPFPRYVRLGDVL